MQSINGGKNRLFSAARTAAYCAVSCALLIAVQLALGAVAGVELVTAVFAALCAYFGVIFGVVCALSFSLLRCLIWGFYPAVFLLYIIYYPLFALAFGLLGKIREDSYKKAGFGLFFSVNLLLILLALSSCFFALSNVIKISQLYLKTFKILLWIICGISLSIIVFFNILFVLVRLKKADGRLIKLFLFCAVACVFTVFFTLLDDVISPLIIGMTPLTALSYFYASFAAMLPQVICVAASVPALYYPITLALTKACPKRQI